MITTIERTTAQTITAITTPGDYIVFNNVISNDLGCTSFNQTSFDGWYQFPATGISVLYNGTYLITANVSFPISSGALGVRYMSITAESSVDPYGSTNITAVPRSMVSIANTAYAHSLSATVSWRLFVNTVIRMQVWQTNAAGTGSAGTVTTAVASATTLNASLSAALILQ